jgi:hypothetical protein
LLDQVLEILKSRQPAPAPKPTPAPADDTAGKIGAILKSILDGINAGRDGTLPKGQLGQVNGALGDTIGNLLDGKKSGIGIIGALLSGLLPTLMPMLTSNASILGPITAASGIGLPISLALAAWGALGKMEKWSGNSPPTGTK